MAANSAASLGLEEINRPHRKIYFRRSPENPLLRRESVECHPRFSKDDFLSGSDYGRDRLIRAQYRFGWAQIREQGAKWAIPSVD
jgi:hypothetical protein